MFNELKYVINVVNRKIGQVAGREVGATRLEVASTNHRLQGHVC